MEIGQQFAPSQTPDDSAQPSTAPHAANTSPMHTQTQSTLAPTAEFTRIFLLAWIIRYIFRGAAGMLFNEAAANTGLRNKIVNIFSTPGRWIKGKTSLPLSELEDAAYASAVGIGSGWLSYRYSRMVRSDIQNIFAEAVAYEHNKTPHEISFKDITASDNNIVRRTVQNYREKLWSRVGTDGLFFGAAALRLGHLTDFFLGLKGVQIFADTWKRKTTMFEDLITFINNKINPRNGLGQAITVGEVFDLYQHYAEAFAPDRMFKTVLEQNSAEGARWAKAQPIFERMTGLMNLTYAYKHSSKIDPQTDRPIRQADFALPKFIYLLGHNLIDINQPEQTLTLIEIASHYGIPAVKEAHTLLDKGTDLKEIQTRFPTPTPAPTPKSKPENGKNAVLPKGSTMQLDSAEPMAATPLSTITPAAAELQQTLAANDSAIALRA